MGLLGDYLGKSVPDPYSDPSSVKLHGNTPERSVSEQREETERREHRGCLEEGSFVVWPDDW